MPKYEIPCKYVKHTGWRFFTRVYWHPEENPNHYHNAMLHRYDIPFKDAAIVLESIKERTAYLIPRHPWPTKCEKDDTVVPPFGTPDVNYQFFYEQLYDNPPRLQQPGDIFDVPWNAPKGATDSYAVVLPNRMLWFTYQCATNCSHPDMHGERDGHKFTTVHKCWTTTGEPPNLDVNPSIFYDTKDEREWHGHLRNGKLVWD